MKSKTIVTFTKEQKAEIRRALISFFLEDLEIELNDFQADFLIDTIDQKMGKYYYNQGVGDTIKELKEKSEDLWLLLKE